MPAPLMVLNVVAIGSTAPHADTVRWTYTVPANRFAIVELLHLKNKRDTAAAPAGSLSNYVGYTVSGGTEQVLINTQHFAAAVDAGDSATWGSEMRLATGDRLRGRTSDTSTGGASFYYNIMKATEYDA